MFIYCILIEIQNCIESTWNNPAAKLELKYLINFWPHVILLFLNK